MTGLAQRYLPAVAPAPNADPAPVWSVAFDRTGRLAASGHADGRVLVWDVARGTSRELTRHADAVRAVAIAADGTVASASADTTIRVLPGAWTFGGHESAVWAVEHEPHAARLLSGAADGTVRRWDLETGDCVQVLAGHTATVAAIVHAPDGSQAITCSGDATARVWDLAHGECAHVLRGHEERVWDAAYRRDGARALTASADGTVRVWATAGWTCLRILELRRQGSLSFAYHPPWVTSVEYLHDGRHALLGASDGSVQIWDSETGERVSSLRHHAEAVLDLAADLTGRPRALSASLDGDVRAWNLVAGTSRRWSIP